MLNHLTEESILGVKVNTGLNTNQVLEYIESNLLTNGEHYQICTTNPEFIMAAQKDSDFKKIVNESAMSLPDGGGILFAVEFQKRISRFKKNTGKVSVFFPLIAFYQGIKLGIEGFVSPKTIGDRNTGVELTYKLCELAAKKGYTVAFLGGWPRNKLGKDLNTTYDMAQDAAERLKKMYPGLKVVAASSKFKDNASYDEETRKFLLEELRTFGTKQIDFLFVAYNFIPSVKWIDRNVPSMPIRAAMGIGSTLDYIVGHKVASPSKVSNRNIEWLFKLLTQPWRYKRIFSAFPAFPWRIFINSLHNDR